MREPLIVLNSTLKSKDDSARLVDVAFPSLVQGSYAPKGWDLAAVTVRGEPVEEAWLRGGNLLKLVKVLGVHLHNCCLC